MIYFVFGRFALPLSVFWSGESKCKDSASEWNDKTKHAVFVFHSRAPPILFKDSANERKNIKFT